MTRGRIPLSVRAELVLKNVASTAQTLRDVRREAKERAKILVQREIAAAQKTHEDAVRDAWSIANAEPSITKAAIKRARGNMNHDDFEAIIVGVVQKPWKFVVKNGKAHLTRFLDWDVSMEVYFDPDGQRNGIDHSVPDEMISAFGSDEKVREAFQEMLDDIREALK